MRFPALVFVCALGGCGGTYLPPLEAGRIDHTDAIHGVSEWQRLAHDLDDRTVGHVEEVKFLIDLSAHDPSGAPLVYFVDSHRYGSHYEFAQAHLDRAGFRISGPMEFYVSEYRRPERRFWLGSLLHYRDADRWAFEILSGDNIGGPELVREFALVTSRVFFGAAARFHPLSDLHEHTLATLPPHTLPTVDDEALQGGWSYEPLELGTAFGYVTLVSGHLDPASVRPNQIVVTSDVPDDIPVCAALVTSRFQAPLAHVALLSANRHTPDLASRDAIHDGRFTRLDGRLARLDVTDAGISLRIATLEEATAHWAQIRPAEPFSPRLDTDEARLVALTDLHATDVAFAGAKAANLGEVARLEGVEVPAAFVVPARYFVEHLAHNGITTEVTALLADPTVAQDASVRAARLAALRERIAGAPVDPMLVSRVTGQIRTLRAPGRLRFRSSTNAEDLAGFNGAGLYASITVAHDPTSAQVATALAGVWASVFNLGAHEEREWYRIDHARVAMAVLVQVSVDDGVANGVALTANPFDATRPAVFIDDQTMDGSVTGATGDEVPEQFLVLTYLPEREPEVMSRSSRTHGRPILSDADALRLTDALTRIHDHFSPSFTGASNAMDVEFLAAGPEHRPVIVQARPFAITYRH